MDTKFVQKTPLRVMLMRNIQADLHTSSTQVPNKCTEDLGDSLPQKKCTLTSHNKKQLGNCIALSQLKVVYHNQNMQMSGRDTRGKINSKEKGNQHIRNVLKGNLQVKAEQGPWFVVWL